MCSPQSSVSSPVLPMMVSAAGGRSGASPRRSLAAPVPPARAAIFIARLTAAPAACRARGRASFWYSLASPCRVGSPGHAPDRGPAAPAEEPEARPAAQRLGKVGLGNGNETRADPDAVECLRAGIEGVDALSLAEAQGVLEETDRDVEGRVGLVRVRCHDHRSVQHGRITRALEEKGADEPVPVPGPPAGGDGRLGRGPRADESEQVPGVPTGTGERAVREPFRKLTSSQAPSPSGSWRAGTSPRASRVS